MNHNTKEVNGERNNDIPDESFLMVAQTTWEDDIIWDDSEETKQKVLFITKIYSQLGFIVNLLFFPLQF